jgi:tetratricopeptide (TPR) repeat protein
MAWEKDQQKLRRRAEEVATEQSEDAAINYLRLEGQPRLAAELLVEWGKPEQGVDLMLEAGDPAAAARIALAARQAERAAECFLQAGDLRAAARCYEKANMKGQALQLYMRIDDVERVMALARFEVDNKKLLRIAADYLSGQGHQKATVEILSRAGDHKEAGELMESLGKKQMALRYYEKHDVLEPAARLYQEAGEWQAAARLFLRARSFQKAANALLQAGQPLVAARLYRRLNKPQEALSVLTEIAPSSPYYRDAMCLASVILEQQGAVANAAKKLTRLLDVIGYGPHTEEIMYRLVDLQLDRGDMEGAEQTLDKARDGGMDPETIDQQKEVVRKSTSDRIGEVIGEEQRANASPSTSLAFPRNDRYRLITRLAKGGNGMLFRVFDYTLDKEVVLKLMHSESLPSKQARVYFKRETEVARALDHPNIVKVFDIGELCGRPFFTMELVSGVSLGRLVEREGNRLPLAERIEICMKVCAGLAHAHDHNIVHRDVKMANVMVQKDGQVKLLDFGLAKALDDNPHASLFIVGTPGTMAPEQLRGLVVDARADIYGLGAMMYHLFSGRPVFDPARDVATREFTLPPDPRKFRENIPEPLVHIIFRCLQPETERRYQSVVELGKVLAEL